MKHRKKKYPCAEGGYYPYRRKGVYITQRKISIVYLLKEKEIDDSKKTNRRKKTYD